MTLLDPSDLPVRVGLRDDARLDRRRPGDPATAAFIAQLVAMALGVPVRDIAAASRKAAPAALARQVAIYLAHTVLGWPLSRVGLAFGRDRSTAAHACRRVEDLRDDPGLDALLAACEASIRAAPAPGAAG